MGAPPSPLKGVKCDTGGGEGSDQREFHFRVELRFKPRTHDRGTRRAKHIVFLVEFLVRLSRNSTRQVSPFPSSKKKKTCSLFGSTGSSTVSSSKNVHTTGFLDEEKNPSKFLAGFCRETRSCVRGFRDPWPLEGNVPTGSFLACVSGAAPSQLSVHECCGMGDDS